MAGLDHVARGPLYKSHIKIAATEICTGYHDV